MTTVAALTLTIENMLYGLARIERPAEDTVTTVPAPADTGTTITPGVVTGKYWQRGDYAEVVGAAGAESEIFIFAADASGSTVIRRGQRGTTAFAITTSSILRKNPIYPRAMIADFIAEVISDHLANKVWYHTERTLAWIDQNTTYPLSADDSEVLRVYQFNLNNDEKLHPFHSGMWSVVPLISTAVETTGKALLLRSVMDTTETVFFTARTIPKLANIASFPDRIANLIPWAVCGLMLGGTRTAPHRADPNRQALPESNEGGTVRDWRFFEGKFLQKRGEVVAQLKLEERWLAAPKFVRHQRSAWIGR